MAGHETPRSVLFACGMNSIRSPIAAATVRHYFPKEIYARSCGVRRGTVDRFVDEVLAEIGLDLGTHRAKSFEELEETNFDVIIAMTPDAHQRALDWAQHTAGLVEYWQVLDPSVTAGSRDVILAAYREVRDMIVTRVLDRFGYEPGR